jgi:WD40 repeat protein
MPCLPHVPRSRRSVWPGEIPVTQACRPDPGISVAPVFACSCRSSPVARSGAAAAQLLRRRTSGVGGVRWYLWVVRHSGKVVLGAAVVLGAVACVFLVVVVVGQGVVRGSLWAGVLAALGGVVAAVAAIWPLLARPSRDLVPPGLEVPGWVVGRPGEADQVVAALLGRGDGLVGITTGLYGAGGFGKTTLARVVCADARVRRRFRGGVYLVTVGRDIRAAAAVAAKVNDVIKLVAGEESTFADPELAGRRLGAVLDAGPRRLLVVDDVWEAGQLAPFAAAGRRCARLVTTRVPGLLGGRDVAVRVDQMSAGQARRLLTAGLPSLDPVVADGLLAVTGRWPLLLRLVNKILVNAAGSGADAGAAGMQLLDRLRAGGPAVVDDLLGEDSRGLDVGQPGERAQAVRATIEASTSLLGSQDGKRFAELGVFAEDETVPFALVARLWRATAGLDELRSSQLCARLAELALVSPEGSGAGGVALHDVVRDFLRGELGERQLARLNEVLLETASAGLPAASGLAGNASAAPVAWWKLGHGDRYLQDHLIGHLMEAGKLADAERVACDLRWAGLRVRESGPTVAAADLSLVGTPKAARLGAAIARTAHLLAPTDPAQAVVDILHSRLAGDPDWGPQVAALRESLQRPRLVGRWPLPDLLDPALRRVLTGHDGQVNAVAAAPDGSRLATGSSDGTVRIWDVATGQERAVLTGHRGRVHTVAVAPDGSWLATAGARDTRVRMWDMATGKERAVFASPKLRASRGVNVVTVAPDGCWLATGGVDHTVRIWDVATGKQRSRFVAGAGWVTAVVIAPDGTWLATAGARDEGVRIWDVATGKQRASFDTGAGWVIAMALAPDGSWLAAGCSDGTVRIWDVSTGKERATLTGHAGLVAAVTVAPDGSWVAAGASDGTLRIWDVATGKQRVALTGHAGQVAAVTVAPDGSWLAAGCGDGTVRIWDVATARPRAILAGYTGWVDTVAALPDGSGLVTGGPDPRVRLWDVATGKERTALVGHSAAVAGIAVAPDGSWLATAGGDPTIRIWDLATGEERTALAGHGIWTAAVAVAPDGSWLATDGYDQVVRLWDMPTGRRRAVFGGHVSGGKPAEVAPDGSSQTVIKGYDRMMQLLKDATAGKERTPRTHRNAAYAIAVAPDGSWLAVVGLNPEVQVWDVATGKQRFVLEGHRTAVYAAAAAPDGSWLATAGGDGTVRIWDAATGKQREVLTGHRDVVNAVTISSDGNWIASGGADCTVRVWETAHWQTQTLMRVENAIHTCTWLHGGSLACAGPAGLYVFDFLTWDAPATDP